MEELVRNQSHIRSLIMFRALKQAPDLFNFHALHILDLYECGCLENHHIECIVSMFQLRYLSLPCRITELPDQTGNLQNLEVLNIGRCRIKRLPESIVKLVKLMCLHVGSGVKLPDEIGRMQALQELESISIPCNSVKLVEEIGRLTRLRRLTVGASITEELGDQEARYREMLVSSLTELGRHSLESLCISYPDGENFLLDSLFGSCCSLPKLQELNIKDYLYWVPEWTRMLSSLVHLCLSIAGIGEDMQVLEGIPTLLFLRLQLKNPPQLRLVIGSEGFKHLNELHVFCTYSAMPLMFVPGAMPELHRLRLEFQARETMSMYGDFDFGIEHLLGLQNVKVEIGYFSGDTDMEAVAAKDAITTASIIHPNRPLLDVRIHVTMLFIIRERAQLTGHQSATNEVNEEMDFQGTFFHCGDLDNPEVSQKLLQLVSSKSFEAEPACHILNPSAPILGLEKNICFFVET